MSWKKVNLFEYFGHHVFMDEYGFCRSEIKSIFINDINISELFAYKEESKRYERIRFGNTGDFVKALANLFSVDIAKRKNTSQSYYNYGYGNDYLSSDQAVSVKPKTIKVNLRTRYYTTFGYNGGSQEQYVDNAIELNSAKDVTEYFCWFEEGASTSSFKMVILPETKIDDEFYFVGVGKVKVSKMIEYPNKNNDVCEVVDIKNKMYTVNLDSEVFYLPYKKFCDEYEPLNKFIDELRLCPHVARSKEMDICNVYWNKIEEAIRYHVLVYKCLNVRNMRRVLFVADYEIDRNTYYFALDKLVGGEFVFKVTAEDRNGNIIAESRGMTSGSPRFFNR